MPLSSQIKELGAILQKLIKFEPGLILVNKDDEKQLLALMAMRMSWLSRDRGWARGNNGNKGSHKN